MTLIQRSIPHTLLLLVAAVSSAGFAHAPKAGGQTALDRIGQKRGVVVFLGLPEQGKEKAVLELAKGSELLVYVQSASAEEVAAMRQAAEAAGLLGKRIWVDQAPWKR